MARLIDADALMDSLDSLCDMICPYSKIQRSEMCGACLLGGAFDVADTAPTVDPYKYGHWTDRAKSILGLPTEACSVCAEWSVGYKKDYCPNCGAKMGEDEWEEPEINPCRGCIDYDGKGGCKSNGGCGVEMNEVET